MTLREELAARLARIMNRYFGHEGAYPGFDLALADECIRQMEWARNECTGEHWEGDGRDGTRHLVDRSELPLTLAPEDWKP